MDDFQKTHTVNRARARQRGPSTCFICIIDIIRSAVHRTCLRKLVEEHGYTIQKELGQRGSGIVFLVNDKDGNPYVIKKIISKNKKEVEILKSLEHGYIVTYMDLFEDKEGGLFYVVMEYCAGGNLYQRMKAQKERGFFEEQQILDWFVQICLALQYIHKRNIHRDIKPHVNTDKSSINNLSPNQII
ncbi:serine/threonine-protein kinase Nek4-like [Cyprinus carpio]|uniref:non-specific serine/threonine protein kinase n=1 Tax=Cyprinus carpio TaxID=7962 RepID=A0A9Q9Y7W4_CYPCA|nr:serine/threonine-protein kinase Nek4-like [Cyprinus carpio]